MPPQQLPSRVHGLAERPPLLPEVLDDLAGLRVTHLDKVVAEVTVLPFGDGGRERPTEVFP